MAYIGNPPAEAYTNTVKDSFNGDGSTVAFTMSQPSVTNDVRVVVENVIQDPTVAYSCSGTTLTFTSAPPSGTNNIYVVHLGPAVMTTVPPSDIASATTFASNVTVQGAFTSQGIDDNATSTAMTLDTSGNLLVGLSSQEAVGTNAGTQLRADGLVYAAATSDAHILSRRSTDGSVLNFRKDTTTVGSIGVAGGDLYISGGSSHAGIRFDTNILTPAVNGTQTDATVDLGYSSQRFKDLYLSGGVYLGGTGSANKLDDYEEGTWTPTNSEGVSLSMSASNYQKIGNTVHLDAFINIGSNSSGGSVVFGGLPFALGSGVYSVGAFNNRSEELYAFLNPDGIQIRTSSNVTKTFAQMSALFVGFQISYIAA